MSEKIYARLLRLYPSRFRKEYEAEALQLIRDRLRNETGFLKRARLWFDLVADAFIGVPLTYRNSYVMTEAGVLSPNSAGVPSFKVLDAEPMGYASILLGSTLALAATVAFGFLLSRSADYLPVSDSQGRRSPIESVMERLNQPAIPDTPMGEGEEGSEIAAAGASGRQPPHLEDAPSSPAHVPADAKQPDSVEVAGLYHDSKLGMQRDPSLAPIQPARPENAFTAMIRLFDTHDVVMFGEVHDSEQEYLWLCKLVKTPGFSEHVDDVVVDFGNALYQKTVDRYVEGEDVPFEEVQKAWRNVVGDVPVSPEYGWVYKAVREANMEHPGRRGIRLVMGGPPADWDKIRNSADLAPYLDEREPWYARVVKTEVLAKHHHALLIMGAGHFLRGHSDALPATEQRALDGMQFGPGYVEREIRAAGAHPYLVVFGTNAVGSRGEVDSWASR